MKRDDCTGLAIGGNKARHNEFVLAEAIARGADLFVWGGLIQSNNCRQTAAACAKAGLDCHLVLTGPARDEPIPLEGNFLLDNLFGASYEIVDAGMGKDLNRRIIDAATRFQAQGRKVFRWDRTIVTPLAAISYVECAAEIVEQSAADGFVPDAIYVSSSGSTGAGLTLGCRALGQKFPVKNVAYVRWEWDIPTDMADIANVAAAKLELDTRLAATDIDVTLDYIPPGYGKLTNACFDAISLLGEDRRHSARPRLHGESDVRIARRRAPRPADVAGPRRLRPHGGHTRAVCLRPRAGRTALEPRESTSGRKSAGVILLQDFEPRP